MRIGRITIPDDELNFSFARSGGPGGQNVNKVSSKAILHWDLVANATVPVDVKLRFRSQHSARITNEGILVIHSQRFRDQPRNIEDCREKLSAMIAAAMLVPKLRKPTKPSKGAKERRLSAKKRQAQRKAGRGRPMDFGF